MTREPYIDARAAAIHVGYTPTPGVPAHKDPQMRAFYEWVRRHHVQTTHRGRRLLFRRSWLDAALGQCDEEQLAQRRDRLAQMGELARRHARGEVRSTDVLRMVAR